MAQTLYRYGSGFPVVTLPGASREELDAAAARWGPLSARTSLWKDEHQTIEFMGLQGRALNPQPYYVAIIENISVGSGIPTTHLRGSQAGALTGSEVNEREFFKLVSDAQMRFEPGVRYLIDQLIEMGQVETTVQPGEYELEWVGAFEINPRDKEAALLDHARARTLQTNFMTVNEIRQKEGLPEIDGGNVILGLAKAQTALLTQQGLATNNRTSKRKAELRRKFGKPVEYLLAERIKAGDSVHKICRKLGISTDTYYRWVDEYGLYGRTQKN